MRLERNLPYWVLVAGAALWVSAVLLAPVAKANGWSGAPLVYSFFDPVCHQRPDRSFYCLGEPFAVCHRCFGLYTGFLAGLLVLPRWKGLRLLILDRPRLILVFAAPMFVDVALFGLNTPASRFLTGFVAAFPLGVLVWTAAAELHSRALAARARSRLQGEGT
jgi:uncharacterized membrane protein